MSLNNPLPRILFAGIVPVRHEDQQAGAGYRDVFLRVGILVPTLMATGLLNPFRFES